MIDSSPIRFPAVMTIPQRANNSLIPGVASLLSQPLFDPRLQKPK